MIPSLQRLTEMVARDIHIASIASDTPLGLGELA
jgi:hypothetical protein